jgi:CheY-like chemotaxis protein
MDAVGTLAAGIAHEFNNMLAVIIGNAELALDDIREEGPRDNLMHILDASKRARSLIKQMLAFDRKNVREWKPVDMADLTRKAHELLKASLPPGIDMHVDIQPGSHAQVLGDTLEVQQIVTNLANNAIDAMRATGGVLTIDLSSVTLPRGMLPNKNMKPGRYVKLTVKDTGTGMTAGVKDRIFDPLFTTKPQGGGLGMGLSVVYGIVREHNGTIAAESKQGKGSVFTVLLPQLDASSKAVAAGSRECALTGKERILLVDDDPSVVEITAMMLERLGTRVTAFTDAGEALKAFEADPAAFDLVITDQIMPGMSGSALAEKILAIRNDMPVILCTGHEEHILEERAKGTDIREFVTKPIARAELAAAINRALLPHEGF